LKHAEFVGHSCKLCAIEVELTDGARKAVMRVVVAVTEFVEDNKTECFKRDMNEGCGGINGPSLSSSRTGGVGGGAGGGGGRLELRPLFLAMVALAGRARLFGRCAFREKLGLHCIIILGVGQNVH
jgi:hypothetical protein